MMSSTQVHREALQRQTQQDWANREYIELISGSIKVNCRSNVTLRTHLNFIYSIQMLLANPSFYREYLTS